MYVCVCVCVQAHDDPVRSMIWSHNDEWMITCDDGGIIKYWQRTMNNVKAFQVKCVCVCVHVCVCVEHYFS